MTGMGGFYLMLGIIFGFALVSMVVVWRLSEADKREDQEEARRKAQPARTQPSQQ